MRKVITTLALAAIALPAFCQTPITLSQSNYPTPPDTITLLDVTSQVSANPTVSNNGTWNYTGLSAASATAADVIYVPVSSDPNFPTAQFKRTNYLKGLTSSLGYYFDQYFTITASGAQAIGMHVPAQNYGLGALTGNNSDTLYIYDNVITYSAPRDIVAFPATAGSTWASRVRCVVNMALTVASAGLNMTPMQQAFYYNRIDTVNGWGTLELPAMSGFETNLPVLANISREFCTDSFYIGGSPAPAALTGPFGITQGQMTAPMNFRIFLYRAGAFSYQMLFIYTDNTFTALASTGGVYINTALPLATGINDIAENTTTSYVYPDPVAGTQFHINCAEAANAASVSLYDISGRLVETMQPAGNGNRIDVTLAKPLSGGIYIYTVNDKTGNTVAHGKLTSAN